jgi:toxin ParE1/3/4
MKEAKLAIEFAPNAEKALNDIEDFITDKGGLETAVGVIDEILQVCSSLQTLPRIGRAREDISPGVRSITSGNYVIYYRIKAQSVEILRVWHGYRDTIALKNDL